MCHVAYPSPLKEGREYAYYLKDVKILFAFVLAFQKMTSST